MEDRTRVIKIESILGGEAPASHFASQNQFLYSQNIDPAQPTSSFGRASGLLVPVNPGRVSSETMTGAPMWIRRSPKNAVFYIYSANGSVYTYNSGIFSDTASGATDLNDGGTASGNGLAYYDNYIYAARDTTIARYGPLNGTASWTDDYWVTTLGKTALTDTTYPNDSWTVLEYPNHVLHRHSDGKLYIADMVGNQGTIHYIQTSKTTVEGDTDAGSTYSKLQVGYGLLPTAMESYGSNLVIAFCEVGKDTGTIGTNSRQLNAKLAFWDTTSQNVNIITWSEYPDSIITALKNINGVLYVFSGSTQQLGCRITRYVGGYSVEEVAYIDDLQIQPPFPGAVDGTSKRLLFGTHADTPSWMTNNNDNGVVVAIGLQKADLGDGIFKVMGSTGSSAAVMSLTLLGNRFNNDYPYIGWSNGNTGGGANGFDIQTGNYSQSDTFWTSQTYKIGQPFKIKKVRIPIGNTIASGASLTARINTDNQTSSSTIGTIDTTSYPSSYKVVLRPTNLTGQYNFNLELEWTGTEKFIVGLPITIEYELIDD